MNLQAPFNLSALKRIFQSEPARSASLSDCFDQDLMAAFDRSEFTAKRPFPWYNFQSLLTEETFQKLYREFPNLDFFEKHEGMARKHGQKPHDRFYLAYEEKIDAYKKLDAQKDSSQKDQIQKDQIQKDQIQKDQPQNRQPQNHQPQNHQPQSKGIIRHEQLSPTWQAFISATKTDPGYRQFLSDLLGTDSFTTRYAWHVATAGHAVSPHVDARNKIGTHIFYFNTTEDWQADWGGSTLVLDQKHYDGMNPEVSDFGRVEAVEVMNNRSFLFKNQPEGWHAVDTLKCPAGVHRRIFNVIVEVPAKAKLKRKLFGKR